MLIFVLYALVLSAVIGLSARAIAQLVKEHKENKGV
jgi:hypothetical protein